MSERRNIFFIHSWEEAGWYARAMELLTQRESGIFDYSAPPWRPVDGSTAEVAASIEARISTATAVVILNTPGLHKRKMSAFEMATAAAMRKRIVVLQPHGDFWHPIPEALDGHVYRVAPWRSDVLGRAIRGEYQHDGRIFDIAERAERRLLVQWISMGIGTISLALLIRTAASFSRFEEELAGKGVRMQWRGAVAAEVAKNALTGALIAGGLTALLTGDAESTLWAAAGGGVTGAAVGALRRYQAALYGTASIRVMAIEAPE